MVKIPFVKIPSVRVGSIDPTSDIGTGGATSAPPTPITYLTRWKIVGNSEVHTDPYLTSWKVSGNSVVDNNTILSCGDYSSIDNKYHIKISDGSNVYDIPLTAPLRKVGSVADKIEFANGVATLTRYLKQDLLTNGTWKKAAYSNRIQSSSWTTIAKGIDTQADVANIICEGFETKAYNDMLTKDYTCGKNFGDTGVMLLYAASFVPESGTTPTQDFYDYIAGKHILFELLTPITELIDAPQISVSPTNTYTSANVIPYSAFEYTENKEIWSCGEYNATDGKYHILVQPLGGSIADIVLNEPLRKVNNIADSIEFPSTTEGKALVTRNLLYDTLDDKTWQVAGSRKVIISSYWRPYQKELFSNNQTANILVEGYTTYSYTSLATQANAGAAQSSGSNGNICIYDDGYIPESGNTPTQTFYDAIVGKHILLELATPTTELVDAPQIEEADSYSCEISQGGKAVSWSSFTTDSE